MFYENQVTLAEESAEPPGTSLLGRSARTTVLSGNGRSERAALLGRKTEQQLPTGPTMGSLCKMLLGTPAALTLAP